METCNYDRPWVGKDFDAYLAGFEDGYKFFEEAMEEEANRQGR